MEPEFESPSNAGRYESPKSPKLGIYKSPIMENINPFED
jgi:hypothetical protein